MWACKSTGECPLSVGIKGQLLRLANRAESPENAREAIRFGGPAIRIVQIRFHRASSSYADVTLPEHFKKCKEILLNYKKILTQV
jgi:hypothetical protein